MAEDYKQLADKLRAERIEKEQQDAEQEAKAKQDAENKRLTEIAGYDKKTQELLPLFKQFAGYKIADGHIGLRVEVAKDNYGADVLCLKIDTMGSSVLDMRKMGLTVLTARFWSTGKYRIERYRDGLNPLILHLAGEPATPEETMKVVAKELSTM